MHDALGNPLVIEVVDFLAQGEVFKQRRATHAGAQRVLIVRNRHAMIAGENVRSVGGHLVQFVAVSAAGFPGAGPYLRFHRRWGAGGFRRSFGRFIGGLLLCHRLRPSSRGIRWANKCPHPDTRQRVVEATVPDFLKAQAYAHTAFFSSAMMASPICWVVTVDFASPLMSAVRRPAASVSAMAFSTMSAAAPRLKE